MASEAAAVPAVRDRRLVFWTLFVSLLVIDQIVKAWVRGAIPQSGSISGKPWPGIFEITLTYNYGIAFGMLQGAGVLMAPIAIAIAGCAAYYSIRHPRETSLAHSAMALLAAGALGNLIDRVLFGRVTDMFWLRLGNITEHWPIKSHDFPVFNVADACITVAAFALMTGWYRDASKGQRVAVAMPPVGSHSLVDAEPIDPSPTGPVETSGEETKYPQS